MTDVTTVTTWVGFAGLALKVVADEWRARRGAQAREKADEASIERIEQRSRTEIDRWLRAQLEVALEQLRHASRDCDERIADAVSAAVRDIQRQLDEAVSRGEILSREVDDLRREHARCPKYVADIARLVARLDPNRTPTPDELDEIHRAFRARFPAHDLRRSEIAELAPHGAPT